MSERLGPVASAGSWRTTSSAPRVRRPILARASSRSAVGSGAGNPRPRRLDPGPGLGREERREQVDARDPVDHAVMHLAQHGEAAVLETLDEPGLPEGPASIERALENPPDERLQLLLVPRPGQVRVPDVVRQVELMIVDPDRVAGQRQMVAAVAGSAGSDAGGKRSVRDMRSMSMPPSARATDPGAKTAVSATCMYASGVSKWRKA
jgi:hypothetical protein